MNPDTWILARINLLRKTGVFNRSYLALLPNLLRRYAKGIYLLDITALNPSPLAFANTVKPLLSIGLDKSSHY